MPRDGTETRRKILDAAQREVLRRGFAATSVDDIQTAAGISRGTFFYHFPTKDALARALLERYAEQDRELVDGLMARAEKLATDPLQQALVFLALHEELFPVEGQMDGGCLFASYSYEAGLFDDETHKLITDSIAHWRAVLGGKLASALARHPARVAGTDPYLLADLAYGVLQGAFILWRTLGDPTLVSAHIRQLRSFLELLFGVSGNEVAAATSSEGSPGAGEPGGPPASAET